MPSRKSTGAARASLSRCAAFLPNLGLCNRCLGLSPTRCAVQLVTVRSSVTTSQVIRSTSRPIRSMSRVVPDALRRIYRTPRPVLSTPGIVPSTPRVVPTRRAVRPITAHGSIQTPRALRSLPRVVPDRLRSSASHCAQLRSSASGCPIDASEPPGDASSFPQNVARPCPSASSSPIRTAGFPSMTWSGLDSVMVSAGRRRPRKPATWCSTRG
jgi:hypothetical protein